MFRSMNIDNAKTFSIYKCFMEFQVLYVKYDFWQIKRYMFIIMYAYKIKINNNLTKGCNETFKKTDQRGDDKCLF